ncbi:MAG: tetratricopeptide repeat protein, partial [Terriglobales bacterium]
MDLTDPQPGQLPVDTSTQATALRIVQVPQKRRLILCLLLALATIALYNPVSRAPFLNYDDPVYVTENPQVRAGLTWNTVAWAFRTPKSLVWEPMTWLSYAFDSQMFGLGPAGYHSVNMLLHAGNAVLLFLILESVTGLAWRSLFVAALFALHPINVESVAWIAERKNVLSMFFFLVALAAYGWYARRPGIGRYLAVTLAYILALMSKVQVITFPFALLLLDYWPLHRFGQPMTGASADKGVASAPSRAFPGRSFTSLIAEKLPWFGLSVASAAITLHTGSGFSTIVSTDAPQFKFPLWVRLANAAISYVRYLGKAFWPVNLALVYPHPGFAISIPAAVFSAFALLAISALVVIFRERRFLVVGWCWFLGIMVPTLGIVQFGPHALADRYAYIPLLGIFVIVCWGVADLTKRWQVPAAVPAAGAAAILLVLGFALHRQVSFWGDNVSLWSHTLEVTGANSTAEENLATSLLAQGRTQEALPHLQRAHFLQPGDPMATLNLATYQHMLGNYGAALDGYAGVVHSMAAPSLQATARANSGYAHL